MISIAGRESDLENEYENVIDLPSTDFFVFFMLRCNLMARCRSCRYSVTRQIEMPTTCPYLNSRFRIAVHKTKLKYNKHAAKALDLNVK